MNKRKIKEVYLAVVGSTLDGSEKVPDCAYTAVCDKGECLFSGNVSNTSKNNCAVEAFDVFLDIFGNKGYKTRIYTNNLHLTEIYSKFKIGELNKNETALCKCLDIVYNDLTENPIGIDAISMAEVEVGISFIKKNLKGKAKEEAMNELFLKLK